MNEVEQETAQDSAKEKSIDLVNMNSVHFDKNCSVIRAKLKMSAGINNVIVPYKVDTGSDGNIMSLYIYKNIFMRVTGDQLVAIKSESMQLKMYNKTTKTQLGTYAVEIEHENNKKRCKFFVVSGNGQALFGMPDIDTLNIIKVNIHSIGTEQTGDSDSCCTNRTMVQREDTKQETNRAEKCYTNTDGISKSNNKNKPMVNNHISNTVEYFLPGLSYDSDKQKSAEDTQ